MTTSTGRVLLAGHGAHWTLAGPRRRHRRCPSDWPGRRTPVADRRDQTMAERVGGAGTMPGHPAGRPALRSGGVRAGRRSECAAGRGAPRRDRHFGAVDRRRRVGCAAGRAGGADCGRGAGRTGPADRRQRNRLGPDVALRVATAGRQQIRGPHAAPGRLASAIGRQRGRDRRVRRVHVRPVQRRAPRTARRRGRAAVGGPTQDDRPQRVRGPRVHVSHPAEGGQAAGRLLPRHRRQRCGHAGQAHELYTSIHRAQ